MRVPRYIALSIGLAILAAIALTAALLALASPTDSSARLRAAMTKINAAARIAKRPGDAFAYPDGALCRDAAASAAANLERRLASAAAAAGLRNPTAAARIEGPETDRRLVGLGYTFAAEGKYEQAITYLGMLNQDKPGLFVDQLAITRAGTGVRIQMEGRILCLASR
jgi:hypothetical protein